MPFNVPAPTDTWDASYGGSRHEDKIDFHSFTFNKILTVKPCSFGKLWMRGVSPFHFMKDEQRIFIRVKELSGAYYFKDISPDNGFSVLFKK